MLNLRWIFCLSVGWMLNPFVGFAQRSSFASWPTMKLDSLKAVYATSDIYDDEQRAATCRLIGVEFASENRNDSALQWLDRAVALAQDSFALARYYKGRAILLLRLDRIEEVPIAIEIARSFLPEPKDEDELNAHENLLGLYCSYTGRFEKAFRHQYKLLAWAQDREKLYDQYLALTALGLTYYKVYDAASALKYWLAAQKIGELEQLDFERYERELIKTNLAFAWNEAGDFQTSKEFIRKHFKKKADLTDQSVMERWYALGSAYYSLKDFDSARQCVRNSLKLAKGMSAERYISENYYLLGAINASLDYADSARWFLDAAEQIASAKEFQDIELRVFTTRVALDSRMDDLRSKLLYQQKLLEKSDNVFHLRMAAVLGGAIAHDLATQYEKSFRIEKAIVEANTKVHGNGRLLELLQASLLLGIVMVIILLYKASLSSSIQKRRLVEAIQRRESFLVERIKVAEQLLSFGSSQSLDFQNALCMKLGLPDSSGRTNSINGHRTQPS